MQGGLISAIVRTARPRHWIRNLLVAAPLLFAGRLGEPKLVARTAAALTIFCALSSASYLWNDIIDIDRDRIHPVKRNRPIASGQLPRRTARIVSAILAASGLASAYAVGPAFALAALGYLLLNVVYSMSLKHVVYVDVLSIAAGFLLRVTGGAFAIEVEPSSYLLFCTGLLGMFMGFGKRLHELEHAGARASQQREVLGVYRADVLSAAMWLTGGAALLGYAWYARDPGTLSALGTERMMYTAPFVAFGLIRFVLLQRRTQAGDSPTEEMIADVPFMLNLILYIAAVIGVIYWR